MTPWRCPVPTPGLPPKEQGDLIVIAMTILGEAEGESSCGKLAVGWVIKNRTLDLRWPDSPTEVCLQAKQFSCWNADSPRHQTMRMPRGHTFEPVWNECFEAAFCSEFSIDNDLTSGANHYHTRAVTPYWADAEKITAEIGSHVFYQL
ncbi:MAG: cell wall hydrolase [Myxococcota bacterium]